MVLHRLKPGKEEMKKTTKAIAKTNRNLKKEQGHEKDDASLARPVVGIARSLTKSRLGSAAAEQVRGWEKVLHVNVYIYIYICALSLWIYNLRFLPARCERCSCCWLPWMPLASCCSSQASSSWPMGRWRRTLTCVSILLGKWLWLGW